MSRLLLSLIMLIACALPAHALTWTWDQVQVLSNRSRVEVDGYRYYYSADAGKTWQKFLCPEEAKDPALLTRRCTLAQPYPQGARCYAVTAYSSKNGESVKSGAACYLFDQGQATPAPTHLIEDGEPATKKGR